MTAAAPSLPPPDAPGFEVPFPAVEAALKQLWENDHAATKATLINLVILSSAPGSLVANNQLVASLTRDHACRVLLIEATRHDGADLPPRAWINAHCHLTSGRKSVCSEQIAFSLDARKPGLTRNALLAHLLGDLPVILWWQADLDDSFEPALFQSIDRLIIDSSRWSPAALPGRMNTLLAAQASMARPFSIHDLAWTRSYQFRIAIAALFDHPHAQAAIHDIDAGEIVHAPGHASAALLLASWLARGLHWTLAARHGETCIFTNRADREAQLVIRVDAAAPPLGMARLSCPRGFIEVTRQHGDPHLNALISDGTPLPPLVIPADPDDDDALVAALLSRGGKNSLYAAVLPGFLGLATRQA